MSESDDMPPEPNAETAETPAGEGLPGGAVEFLDAMAGFEDAVREFDIACGVFSLERALDLPNISELESEDEPGQDPKERTEA